MSIRNLYDWEVSGTKHAQEKAVKRSLQRKERKLPLWPAVVMAIAFVALFMYDVYLQSEPDHIVLSWPLEGFNEQDSYWVAKGLLSDDPVYLSNILKMVACEDYILPEILMHVDPVESIAIADEILKGLGVSKAVARRGYDANKIYKFRSCLIDTNIVLSELDIESIVRASWNHYRTDSIAEVVAGLGEKEAIRFIMRQYGVNKNEAYDTYQKNFVNIPDVQKVQCALDYDQQDIICKQIGIYSTSNLARLLFHGYVLHS